MGRRTELTLGFLSFFGVMALAVLVWGQQTGELPIFDKNFVSSADEVLPLAIAQPASASSSMIEESFAGQQYLDEQQTTALWSVESGEVTLAPGTTSGRAQTAALAGQAARELTVILTTDETRPLGSTIYYALSTDGGQTWQPMVPEFSTIVTDTSSDWRVRILLDRGSASINPSVQAFRLAYVD